MDWKTFLLIDNSLVALLFFWMSVLDGIIFPFNMILNPIMAIFTFFSGLFANNLYEAQQNYGYCIMFTIYFILTPVFFVLSLLNICLLTFPADISMILIYIAG